MTIPETFVCIEFPAILQTAFREGKSDNRENEQAPFNGNPCVISISRGVSHRLCMAENSMLALEIIVGMTWD